MRKWEYCEVRLEGVNYNIVNFTTGETDLVVAPNKVIDGLAPIIKTLGLDGWELVAVTSGEYYFPTIYHFKRPVQEQSSM